MIQEKGRSEQWITVAEATELVKKTRATIHYHIPRGHFAVKRIGRWWLVDRLSLLEFYKANDNQ